MAFQLLQVLNQITQQGLCYFKPADLSKKQIFDSMHPAPPSLHLHKPPYSGRHRLGAHC